MNRLYILIIAVVAVWSSCNNSHHHTTPTTTNPSETAEGVYQCPMKCQGDTTYTTAGQCPVCKMDLEKI